MNQFSYKNYYHRNLPHIQPEGGTFFITSRLAGSLPIEVVEKLNQERELINSELEKISNQHERVEQAYLASRRLFGKWDKALDESNTGIKYLANEQIAKLVADSLHFRDGKVYDLIAYCIMPNHKHVVFTPLEETENKYFSLSKIMHSLKRHTARQANLALERTGVFWQHENYDHFIRDEAELERIVKYILYNPVKANLVKEQTDWQWSYCKYKM